MPCTLPTFLGLFCFGFDRIQYYLLWYHHLACQWYDVPITQLLEILSLHLLVQLLPNWTLLFLILFLIFKSDMSFS
jgi:hypothetical protein